MANDWRSVGYIYVYGVYIECMYVVGLQDISYSCFTFLLLFSLLLHSRFLFKSFNIAVLHLKILSLDAMRLFFFLASLRPTMKCNVWATRFECSPPRHNYNYTATASTTTTQHPKNVFAGEREGKKANRGLRHQLQQFMCLFNANVAECPQCPPPSHSSALRLPASVACCQRSHISQRHRHHSLPRPAPIIDRSDRSNRHAVSHTNC